MPCRFRAQCRSAGRSRQSRRVCQRVRSPRASSSFVYVRVFRSSYAEPKTLRTDSAHYSHRYREAVKGCFAKSYDELCAQSWDWHVRAVRTLTRMLAVSSLPTSPHPGPTYWHHYSRSAVHNYNRSIIKSCQHHHLHTYILHHPLRTQQHSKLNY
jgi:hypothetical protein